MRDNYMKFMADELDKKSSERSIMKWIETYNIKNEKGEPITFDRHPFLIDIYNDWHPYQVQIKSSQVGLTTAAAIKSLYLAKTKNMNIIHTLPTADFSYDIVKSKIDPIITANKHVIEVNKKTDSTRHKEIGQAHLFYRGTFTDKEGISISADVLINDEYDRSNMDVCHIFESRLDFSKYKYIWRFSNPSVPEYGVDALFKQTKQYHWFIKCSHCGEWQFMNYPDSIDFENQVFMCKKCHKEITDEDRINGLWVPKYDSREGHGYWISQLFCVWHSAKDIISKAHDPDMKKDIFYNFTVGLPYVGSDIRPSRQMIYRCLSHEAPRTEPIVIGIDQGSPFYVSIGSIDEVHRLITLESWTDVDELIAKLNPYLVVIDGLPEANQVRELQDKYGTHKVVPCYYKDNPSDPRVLRWERKKTDAKYTAVYGDKFKTLDNLIRKIVNQKIKIMLTSDNPMLEQLVNHAESLYRKTETNRIGQQYYVWDTSTGKDHFVHAINYMMMASSRLRPMYIDDDTDELVGKVPYPDVKSPEELMMEEELREGPDREVPQYLSNYFDKNPYF